MKKGTRKGAKAIRASSVRSSISFPPELYEILEKLAISKKVSVAWIVREAAEQYVSIQRSLQGEFQK